MTPEVHAALEEQLEAFRKKFGRDPGPGDPVLFDPDKEEPEALPDVEAEVLAAMQKADMPPHFAYAYKKTGLIGVEGLMANWPADRRREWDNAIKECFLIEEASKRPDRPGPQAWSTTIPELLMSPFSKHDLNQVHECLRAIAPIEAQGMKVVTRRGGCNPSTENRPAVCDDAAIAHLLNACRQLTALPLPPSWPSALAPRHY